MKKHKIVILGCVIGILVLITGGYQYRDVLFKTTVIQKGDEENFSAYLKFKRIAPKDKNDRQAIYKKYMERKNLAEAIETQALIDQSLIDAELEEFYKEMLISRYFEKFLKEQITDQALQNYYSSNVKNFQLKKARVAHILLRTNKNMSETERKVKLTTAQEAYAKAKTGIEFETVVKAYSEDTISAKKAGDIGWIKEGAIAASFSEKVFSMKVGELSAPVETAFGFHIIKLLEGPLIVTQPYEVVKGNIRYQLRNKAKQTELNRLTKRMH